MSRILLLCTLIVPLLAAFGCSEDADMGIDRTPEVAVDVTVNELGGCAYWLEVLYHARRSTDDRTAPYALEARWDLADDGTWDVDWRPLHEVQRCEPDMDALLAGGDDWILRCQVRDAAGNVAEHVEAFSLKDMPRAPDLEAVTLRGEEVLQAGKGRWLSVNYVSWGLPEDTLFDLAVLVDGREQVRLERKCNRRLCANYGIGPVVAEKTGEAVITVVLDPDDRIAETDETNNVLTYTASVVLP